MPFHLAGIVARDDVDPLERHGNLVRHEMLATQREQLGVVDPSANDPRDRYLTEPVVRSTDNGDVVDCG